MPAISFGLDDREPTVLLTTCYVVENFVEALQTDTLMTYLPHLMGKLIHVLQSAANKSVQEIALSAIASLAVSAEIAFLPYAEVRYMRGVFVFTPGAYYGL
jgi:hypothetical protein